MTEDTAQHMRNPSQSLYSQEEELIVDTKDMNLFICFHVFP